MRSVVVLVCSALLSACAVVTAEDTQPLLTRATALQTSLRTETAAVDTAYKTIADATTGVCEDAALRREVGSLCDEWVELERLAAQAAREPPQEAQGEAGEQDREGDGSRPRQRTPASLTAAANAGMGNVVGYVRALHTVAEAGAQSTDSSGAVATQLGALASLAGGATGPLGFIVGDGFAQALAVVAQAITAGEVRGTLRDATAQAQLTLDLYAIAMRNALGACEVQPTRTVRERLTEAARVGPGANDEARRLSTTLTAALATIGTDADPCQRALYPQITDRMGPTLELAAQFRSGMNFASLAALQDQYEIVVASISDNVSEIEGLGGLEAAPLSAQTRTSIAPFLTRLRELNELREIIEPYKDQAAATEEQVNAARSFSEDRRTGAVRLAQGFFQLADAHASFATLVDQRRGLDLSGPSAGDDQEEEGAEGAGGG